MTGSLQADSHEIREVIRALVRQPMLRRTRQHRRLVDLASRHEQAVQTWFEVHLGWRVLVDRDRVRLLKVPEDPGRFPDDVTPRPRQCALYCLVLAVLQDCGSQTVITELADRVSTLSVAHTSVRRFDATSSRERRDLVVALRRLVEDGVLTPTQDAIRTNDGEQGYVAGHGNAIYDIDHRAAAFMVACPVPPSLAAGPADLLRVPDDPVGPTHGGPTDGEVRQALMRRIIDHPVVYVDDLPDRQRVYLARHQEELVASVCLGLDTRVEVREEGLAMVDTTLTDLAFPTASAASFMALMLTDLLAEEVQKTGNPQVSQSLLLDFAALVADTVRSTVPTIANRPTDGTGVLRLAEPLLQQLGLIRSDETGGTVLPAAARYRAPRGHGGRAVGEALLLFGPDLVANQPAPAEDIASTYFEGHHDDSE
ncbi:TIGR02678 family protein [Kitasatospora purpeofusca]|uniref:TIGR02678 family protein n=1 Tax=Kitasatospora purpeofusca TaxID=67352 RepID=UPI002E0D2518|nr:TIGR02678 family protein [Kitasatospora purpeofusca]